jgi:hypothetical protein
MVAVEQVVKTALAVKFLVVLVHQALSLFTNTHKDKSC